MIVAMDILIARSAIPMFFFMILNFGLKINDGQIHELKVIVLSGL